MITNQQLFRGLAILLLLAITLSGLASAQGNSTAVYFPLVFHAEVASPSTTRISVNSDGTQGNNPSTSHSISADGRLVAFSSYASDLVGGDTNGTEDIFVHDLETGLTVRVSVASNGAQADGWSSSPSISADGRYVAFDSDASNLESVDTNGEKDIFVYDQETGETSLASISSDGSQANAESGSPIISANGRFVAFLSHASNLVSEDTNGIPDIFVHDRGGVDRR